MAPRCELFQAISFKESSVDLSWSVSSILKMNFPLFFLVKRKLNIAVLTAPRWREPVGLGANRVIVLMFLLTNIYCILGL
jgi:hypothetical protein